MPDHSHSKHEHAGLSSHGVINAKKVMDKIGLSKTETFLDVGCGEGHFSLAAADAVGPKGMIYAVDIDRHAIESLQKEIARKGLGNLTAVLGDVTRHIAVDDESIDVCFMANVMHGFAANKEVESVFREVTRVLAGKGRLAVVDFKKSLGVPGPPRSIRLAPREMEDIIGPYGFKREKTDKAGLFHYLMVFRWK